MERRTATWRRHVVVAAALMVALSAILIIDSPTTGAATQDMTLTVTWTPINAGAGSMTVRWSGGPPSDGNNWTSDIWINDDGAMTSRGELDTSAAHGGDHLSPSTATGQGQETFPNVSTSPTGVWYVQYWVSGPYQNSPCDRGCVSNVVAVQTRGATTTTAAPIQTTTSAPASDRPTVTKAILDSATSYLHLEWTLPAGQYARSFEVGDNQCAGGVGGTSTSWDANCTIPTSRLTEPWYVRVCSMRADFVPNCSDPYRLTIVGVSTGAPASPTPTSPGGTTTTPTACGPGTTRPCEFVPNSPSASLPVACGPGTGNDCTLTTTAPACKELPDAGCGSSATVPPSRAAAGHLDAASGTVLVKRAGTDSYVPLAAGEQLAAGDNVRTGADGRAAVVVGDALVQLLHNCDMTIDPETTEHEAAPTGIFGVVFIDGILHWSGVDTRFNKFFRVGVSHNHQVKGAPRDTEYMLIRASQSAPLYIDLHEGNIDYQIDNGSQVRLRAGQRLVVTPDGKTSKQVLTAAMWAADLAQTPAAKPTSSAGARALVILVLVIGLMAAALAVVLKRRSTPRPVDAL